MKIVLTNDDGYLSNEIQTLKVALREAGHFVTLVAPVSNQSWGGTTLQASASETRLIERGENEYSLQCEQVIFKNGDPWPASPVQCYLVGENILPDLDVLISGMNIGQNTEGSSLFSGTIGAVYAGISRVIGTSIVPAIGISLGEFANEERVIEGAQFVVKLIDYLSKKRKGKKLLPKGLGLNVNIPGGLPSGEQIQIVGISFNRAGGVYNIPGLGDDNYRVISRNGNVFQNADIFRTPITDIPYSDNSSLNEGYITIVPLVADTTANLCDAKKVSKILSRILTDKSFSHNLNVLKHSVASQLK